MELDKWREAVSIHMKQLDTLIDDRRILKEEIEPHLRTAFQWDEIDYNRDFSEITLKWKKDHHPIILHENIKDFGMDWEICAEYDDSAFRIVVVKIYPFGVPIKEETP